jgi:hypothetical protein
MSKPDGCTCRPGATYIDEMCWLCARKARAAIYKTLTPAQKAYDKYVDPQGAYHTDFDAGCSCHINPPCNYCIEKSKEDQ